MIQALTKYFVFSLEPLICSPYVLTQANPHRVFPTGGMGEVPPVDENLLILPNRLKILPNRLPHQIFYPPLPPTHTLNDN